ncbi:hypothetical protein J0A67_22970, partial [Algoriphagus aestuariicola]
PSLSAAAAAMETVSPTLNCSPEEGEVMLTVGLAFAITVIFTASELVTAPLLSVALAVMLYSPAETFDHE